MKILEEFTIKLPFPPSTNHLYIDRVVIPKDKKKKPFVNRFMSPEGEAYKKTVVNSIKALKLEAIKCDVSILCSLIVKDKIRRDVDNYNKALLDGISDSGLINDDSQIVNYNVRKVLSSEKNHCIIIRVQKLDTSIFGVAVKKKVAKRGTKKKVSKRGLTMEFLRGRIRK